jgi:hypothetical protein
LAHPSFPASDDKHSSLHDPLHDPINSRQGLETPAHQLDFHDTFQLNDFRNKPASEWGGYHEHHNLHQPEMPDLSQTDLLNPSSIPENRYSQETFSSPDSFQHNFSSKLDLENPGLFTDINHQTDSAQPLPEQHHNFQEMNNQWDDHGSGHSDPLSHHIEFHSSYSIPPGGSYVHIDKDGDIYLHKLNGKIQKVGYVDGKDFYNVSNEHLGYLRNDGHICKWRDDRSIGRIESGHLYMNDKEIGRADTSMEGAAHIFFVVYGGQYGCF